MTPPAAAPTTADTQPRAEQARRAAGWAQTVLAGLAAGFFVTWQISVMRGLARLDDRGFVTAMNAFNDTVRTGWFAVIFFGTGVLGVVLLAAETARVRNGRRGPDRRLTLVAVGTLLYVLGVLVVTVTVNLPLNAALGAVRSGPDPVFTAVRHAYESPWLTANLVRTWTAVAAAGCFAAAAMVRPGTPRPAPRP